MSPDRPEASPSRTAWRVMLAASLLLASGSMLLAAVLFSRTDDALSQIQQSRIELCRQTNERHDATIRVLDVRIAQLKGARRARAEANRPATIALIEALSPKRDCVSALTPPPAKRP